jgi:predicted MarR family transcription regulator
MPKYIHYTNVADATTLSHWSDRQRCAVATLCNLANDEENILHAPQLSARQVALAWLCNVFDEDGVLRILIAVNRFFEWGPSMSIGPDDYEI